MKRDLKVAFYTDTFLPAVDGVVTSILNTKKELEKKKGTVYVFTSGNKDTKNITKQYKNVFVTRGVKLKKYPQYNVALFPFLNSMHMPKGVDVIHAHTPFMMGISALITAKINKIPIVASFHTMFINKAVIKEYTVENKVLQKFIVKHAWGYARFFYNKCNAVIAPSKVIKEMLVKHRIKNVFVVPNGIDLKRFNYRKVKGSKLRRQLLRNQTNKLVLYIGRISKEKNIEVLLKAADILRNKGIEFVLGGTGPALDYYKRMSKQLGIKDKVTFVGFIDEKDLPSYYAACDLLCIPSTFETQGIVALEAMAMNKPVVAADYLALKEVVTNGKNGEKFIPNNPASCAKNIYKVIKNISKYKDMRKTAEKYSDERVTMELLNVYKSISNNNT